jgi:hypothetical protein
MDKLEFHPLADLFPMMSDEELDDLGEDMLKFGQHKRVMRYEGMILDGRNRYLACLRKGIEPRFVDYHGPDPLGLVISLNLKRRHLDTSQRAIAAGKIATLRDGQRRSASPKGEAAMTQADAATMLNVGKRSVERAREVVDLGVPDLVAAVEQGEVKVSAAAEFAKAVPPLDQQRLIAEHGSPADAVKATVKAKADRAAHKPQKPKPDVTPAADLAEQAAAAKLAASAPERIIDAVEELERIDVSPASFARMSDDERIELIGHLAMANAWLNKAVAKIAISGGANFGKLAPVSLRLEALEFLHMAAARMEAELPDQGMRGSAS